MSVILLKMSFSERLKQLRTSRGMTQEALAQALNIPSSNIRRYESDHEGVPRKERLETFADFFGVSIDYLMGRVDDEKKVLSHGANELFDIIELSEDDAIQKIMKTFNYKGKPITEDQARTIYYVSLGALK